MSRYYTYIKCRKPDGRMRTYFVTRNSFFRSWLSWSRKCCHQKSNARIFGKNLGKKPLVKLIQLYCDLPGLWWDRRLDKRNVVLRLKNAHVFRKIISTVLNMRYWYTKIYWTFLGISKTRLILKLVTFWRRKLEFSDRISVSHMIFYAII